MGFGAYHGSAKTYEAEILLIKSLKKQGLIDYYIPETSYSQAFFFQQYLETGNEELLRELTLAFQTIVNQEGTVETFEHWKKLRLLNKTYPQNPIKVLGFDAIAEYQFPIKHILLLIDKVQNWKLKTALQTKFDNKEINFSTRNKETTELLKNFISDYEENKSVYSIQISDTISFHHILKNFKYNFDTEKGREEIIFDNYVYLKNIFTLGNKKQFFKYGFFHIEKQREENSAPFFTRIIEQNVYDRNNVITVMGYLTKSEVLWDKIYDDNGDYEAYTVEKGFGIGDYWKEYFKGIKNLKKTKLSDVTLFKLNGENSPYKKGTDLIEVKLFLKKSNRKTLKNKPTTDFIDYAVLISNSKNQIPIEEME
ncbi:hypothetical protein DN752_02760 [Echinicola strongylocentroti]|uniref:Uncharacterized protein n=2 Tax=Echinicola strongylocentroti TaxID=1795355 RepID=A0A2Z4IE97_9BACT|nr:hypothetical protein DN752_02760 [Echinicola strongylocentroti]